MVKKKVSIIIPNFNGEDLLKQNINSVLRAAKFYSKETEIIVVDDGSSDGSVDFLKTLKDIRIIEKNKNEGFSATCNIGVENANGEIVILLNTDLSPELEFIEPLVKHFNDENVFAVGSLEKSKEGGIVLRGRGIGVFKNGFLVHSKGEVDGKTSTLWASGGSSAYSREKWIKLGGLDRIFDPFYWEDIDLSYRALKNGWKIVFERSSVVVHEHKKGAISKNFKPSYVEAIAFRNHLIFMWKNITDISLLSDHILLLPFNLLKFIFKGKEAFLRGFLLAVGKLPVVISHRKNVPNKVPDRKIVEEYYSEF